MKRTQSRWWLTALLLPALGLTACTDGGGSSSGQGGGIRPTGQTEFVTRTGGSNNSANGGPTAGRGGQEGDFAGTNAPPSGAGTTTQPRTVEESDIYKVVGNTLFVLNRYRGLQVLDISNLDAPQLIGRAPIYGYPRDMYVKDNKAYVIVSDYYSFWRDELAADDVATAPYYGSQLRIIDISNVTSPQVIGGINLEGDCTDSRIVGDVLYVVSQRYPWYNLPGSTDNEDSTNVLAISVGDSSNVAVVDTASFPRNGWEHHLSVTANTIYVAASGYRPVDINGWNYQPFSKITYVDISDPAGHIQVRGDIELEGRIPDRWAMDEYQGVLRVASGQSWGNGDVYLTTINVANPNQLTQLGRYTLHVDENLMSARFDGARGYLVSYRNIDPLFTFDLSNPASPVLLGELEMTGWLDFMVPMGDRMVALGHEDTTVNGERQISLAVSLIDVGAGHDPVLLDRETVGEGWGWVPGERDDFAKVFRVLGEQGLILLPFQSWSRADYRYLGGVQLLDFSRDALAKRGLIQNAGWVERGIPHGPSTVFTLSSEVFQVMDITNRDSPALRGRLELARNVQDFATLGEEFSLQLHGDWYAGDTTLAIVPLADPDSATPTASLHVPAPYGRMFRNGNLVYLSSVQAVDDGNGGERHVAKVQVVDVSNPSAPVIRGSVDLPEEVYGWYGSWYWGSGDQVVQVNDHTLAFFRYRYNYWWDERNNTGDTTPTHTLYLVDLTNADAPVLASTLQLADMDWAWGLQARGNNLFLSEYESFQGTDTSWYARYFLRRIDVSNAAAPVLHPRINIPGMFVGGQEDGNTVYTLEQWWEQSADGNGTYRTALHALALSGNLAYLQSSVELPGYIYSLEVEGNSAFTVANTYGYTVDSAGNQQWYNDSKLLGIDLSNPRAIRVGSEAEMPLDWGYLLAVEGGRAFVGSGPGIFSYAVGDINAVAPERFFRTQGWAHQVVVQGSKAYVPSGYHGVQVLDLLNPQ